MRPALLALAFAGLFLATRPAFAWVSPAPDVVVDCPAGLAPAVAALGAAFRAQGGAPVHVFTGADARLFGLILHRARADIVIGDTGLLDRLAAAGLLRAGAPVVLGRDPLVVVAPSGMALGGVSDAADLVSAHRVVVTDATVASDIDGAAVLRRVAGGGALAESPVGVADGATVIDTVMQGIDLVGIARGSDAAGRPGVRVAARVEGGAVVMAAALTRNGQSGRAGDFLAFMGHAAWTGAGLEAGR